MEQYHTSGPYQIDSESIKVEPDIKPVSNLLFIDSIKLIENLKKQILEEYAISKDDMSESEELSDKDWDDFLTAYENDFELHIRNQEEAGIKLKFTDEVRKNIICKNSHAPLTKELIFEFYYYKEIHIYTSKKKSVSKAWQDFVKNFWYSDKQKEFRIKAYVDILNSLQ